MVLRRYGQGDDFGVAPVAEEAEVADAHKSSGQHMQQEPPQEFFHGQRHDPLLVVVGGIAPPESNTTVCEGN